MPTFAANEIAFALRESTGLGSGLRLCGDDCMTRTRYGVNDSLVGGIAPPEEKGHRRDHRVFQGLGELVP